MSKHIKSNISEWCDRIIHGSFYLLFILVPLILTPWNYELFEFNKMIVTYALTVIIASAWIVKMGIEQRVYIKRTPLDIPILLFALSQLVSSLFSMDPHVSWFGYYSRFNGGMLSIFSYIVLYYAFVSNWKGSVDRLLQTMLATGAIVATYGILQRLGIDKHLWVQDVQNRVFSTLGQPNWLAAYLVAMMPIALWYALREASYRSYLFASLYGMFFITLLFTRSRSGIIAFGFTFVLYLTIATMKRMWTTRSIALFFAIHAVLIVFTFFNGSHIDQIDRYFSYRAIQERLQPKQQESTTTSSQPQQSSGTLLEFGGTDSGKIRRYVWEAAIRAWLSSQKTLFIGTGTETFALTFFQHKPIEHNLTSEWDFLYNKAHNEYLNYLATTGALGLGAYTIFLVGALLIFGWLTHKAKIHHEKQHETDSTITIAILIGWTSLLITNFFGFSVVITELFLFLFPAISIATSQAAHRSLTIHLPNIIIGSIVGIIGTIAGTVGFIYIGTMWVGDYFFAKGSRLTRAGKLQEGYINLVQATLLRPKEPLYYDELSLALGSLAVVSLDVGNATQAVDLTQKSLMASDIALSMSPNNVNFWKTRTKIYFSFADIDQKFVHMAKEALEKAQRLSPNDPKISYNLAILDGRLGNNAQAIETLRKTIAMKPNYRDAYYALYVFYKEVKQPELAKTVLEEYLKTVDPNDQEFQSLLAK